MPRKKNSKQLRTTAMEAARRAVKNRTRLVRETETYRDARGQLITRILASKEEEIFDWSKCTPDARAREANRALTLSPVPGADYFLHKAFEEFGLDPKNPRDWRLVTKLLAYLYFGEIREWDQQRLLLLKARCDSYSGNNTEKIRELRRDYPDDYKRIGTDRALRELLERAQKLACGVGSAQFRTTNDN